MRYIHSILYIIIGTLILSACTDIEGNGEVISETRDVTGFKAIDVDVPADVYFAIGDAYQFQIDGESNIIPEIDCSIKNDVLTIEFKDNINFNYKPQSPLKIMITAPQLTKLTVSGSTHFYINTAIREGTFTCKTSGAASVHILTSLLIDKGQFTHSGASNLYIEDLRTNEIKMKTSGAATVSLLTLNANESTIHQSGVSKVEILSGNTQDLSIDLSGSTLFLSKLFLSKNANVSASGAASATVCVSEKLSVDASGAATIAYMGEPNTDIKTSGAATVKNKPLFEAAFLNTTDK